MERFKHENKFLNYIFETKKELYSILELTISYDLTPKDLFEKPKFIPFLLDGVQYSDGVSYLDAIFNFDSDIYIYLSKSDAIVTSFSCKIYYPIIKRKDVEFFIINLKKNKKNGN